MSATSPYAAHEGGFFERGKTSPIGIGGAIAIHVGAAAVFLMMPGMPIGEKVFPPPLITYPIPAEKPPPEPTQKPHPKDQTDPTESRVTAPIPQIPLPTNVDFPVRTDPTPFPPQGDPPIGVVDPPPVHKPVLVDSRMDPRYARNLQPDYPPARLREEEEGKVTVRVRIGADGRVLSVEQLFASHPDFWRAAQAQALKAWRFLPATRDGVPVESIREMTVYFKMDGQ